MTAKFWGARGSIPTPLTPAQLRSKIAAVVQRIRPADLRSQQSREAFLAALPPEIFGAVGGNTTCLEVRDTDENLVIVDAGSGIRELDADLIRRGDPTRHFPIFFTHFHWDHLMGLPFFRQAYMPQNKISFFSPVEELESLLRGQMDQPYFPVPMSPTMAAELEFLQLVEPPITLGNLTISWKPMKHPQGSFAYKFVENGRHLVFATDAEITDSDFDRTDENVSFFEDIDVLILDSQYTLGEAIEKYDWGHTSYSMAVDFATAWKVKRLYLTHHEPLYGDRKIFRIERTARWYKRHLDPELDVKFAIEGDTVTL